MCPRSTQRGRTFRAREPARAHAHIIGLRVHRSERASERALARSLMHSDRVESHPVEHGRSRSRRCRRLNEHRCNCIQQQLGQHNERQLVAGLNGALVCACDHQKYRFARRRQPLSTHRHRHTIARRHTMKWSNKSNLHVGRGRTQLIARARALLSESGRLRAPPDERRPRRALGESKQILLMVTNSRRRLGALGSPPMRRRRQRRR